MSNQTISEAARKAAKAFWNNRVRWNYELAKLLKFEDLLTACQSAIDAAKTEALAECRAISEEQICGLQDRVAAWIRTAERPPTKEDADVWGNVFVADDEHGREGVDVTSLENATTDQWPYWMPIPPVPGAAAARVEPTDKASSDAYVQAVKLIKTIRAQLEEVWTLCQKMRQPDFAPATPTPQGQTSEEAGDIWRDLLPDEYPRLGDRFYNPEKRAWHIDELPPDYTKPASWPGWVTNTWQRRVNAS